MGWLRPDLEQTLARIDAAFDKDDAQAALKLSARAMKRFEGEPDLWIRHGDACLDLGLLVEARRAYARATELDPEWAEAWVALADVRVELDELAAAEEDVARARALVRKDPAAIYVEAVIKELTGRRKAAEKAYALAEDLDPDGYFRPHRISARAFDAVLRQAIELLPDDLQDALAEIEVIVRRFPSRDEAPAGLYNPLLMGLFVGTALPERTYYGDANPLDGLNTRIYLFQGNLERRSATREELVEEIHVTLLHELGHYLGYDEEAVWRRGLR